MSTPRFTKDELWARVRRLYRNGTVFLSLVRHHKYTIASLDEPKKAYAVGYESRHTKSIPLADLFAAYQELYRLGRMRREHMRKKGNGLRIFGHTRYSHAPGPTICGILPALDDAIRVERGGHLSVGLTPNKTRISAG